MSVSLSTYFTPQTIELHLAASHRQDVLASLVQLLVRGEVLPATNGFLDVLMARESLGSTGIGHGVAIPHGRSAEVRRPCIALGRTLVPVPFQAIDDQPTQLFFLLASPEQDEDHQHLFVLARLAKWMKNPQARQQLLDAPAAEAIVHWIQQLDATP